MKGNTKAKTPTEYLNGLEEPRKGEMKKLHQLIRKTVPNMKPVMMSGMIGYGPYHYKYPSGREGDWFTIGLASQKNYISVYVCAVDGKEYITEKNKDKLGKTSVGKSCIRFKKLEVLKKATKVGPMWEASTNA
jgi:hypothetical protein